MTRRKLRVGIISANWGAQAHLPAWRTLDDVEVVAICTSRRETAEAAAATYAIPRPFWDHAAMAADPDIDIIDVGTNPLQRETMVAAALAGGKHVANQLPFATSADAASTLVELQRSRGLVGIASASMVGLPQVAFIREMIDGGDLGEVMQVRLGWEMSYYLPPIPGFPYNWFGKAGLGVGVSRNHGSHLLHLLRHLFGRIGSVCARVETRLDGWAPAPGEWMRNETDDTMHAMVRFEDGGPMTTLSTSWVAVDSPGFSLDIFGSKQRIRLTAPRYPGVSTAELYRAAPSPWMQPAGELLALPDRFLEAGGRPLSAQSDDSVAGPQIPSMARLFGSMADAIRDGGEPIASFARALHVQRVVEALYRSHETGCWTVPAGDGGAADAGGA